VRQAALRDAVSLEKLMKYPYYSGILPVVVTGAVGAMRRTNDCGQHEYFSELGLSVERDNEFRIGKFAAQ
jgi:hypothetical protein